MTVLDQPQHMVALERANQIRTSRARLKDELAALDSLSSIALFKRVLTDFEGEWEGMRVYTLLMACRRFGRARTLKVLHKAQVGEGCTLGCLTERQVRALREAL